MSTVAATRVAWLISFPGPCAPCLPHLLLGQKPALSPWMAASIHCIPVIPLPPTWLWLVPPRCYLPHPVLTTSTAALCVSVNGACVLYEGNCCRKRNWSRVNSKGDQTQRLVQGLDCWLMDQQTISLKVGNQSHSKGARHSRKGQPASPAPSLLGLSGVFLDPGSLTQEVGQETQTLERI